VPSNRNGVIFYRSLSSATKAARTKAEQRYAWLREIVSYVSRFVRFPTVDVPGSGLAWDDPTQIADVDVETVASQTRRSWRLGDAPVANMILLLEKYGVVVARHDLDSDKLDAFSEWNPEHDRPYVILNSAKASAVRSRFDAGHELAHLILHRRVAQKTLNTRAKFRLMEDQANRFSGALLLPESTFAKDIHAVSLDSLRALKPKWRVSVGVMIKRCAHLGLISEAEERRLWLNYSRRGWRKCEPLDDQLEEERPRYLRRCLEILIEKEIVSHGELCFHLALPPPDIEQLLSLQGGLLDWDRPAVALREDDPAAVVPFPGPQRSHGT